MIASRDRSNIHRSALNTSYSVFLLSVRSFAIVLRVCCVSVTLLISLLTLFDVIHIIASDRADLIVLDARSV
jgi:hypothetical protein